MLDTVIYETHILRSATKLFVHDLFGLLQQRHGKQAAAWRCKTDTCGVCLRTLAEDMLQSAAVARGDRVLIFDCGTLAVWLLIVNHPLFFIFIFCV
jgi:hypothetical protein